MSILSYIYKDVYGNQVNYHIIDNAISLQNSNDDGSAVISHITNDFLIPSIIECEGENYTVENIGIKAFFASTFQVILFPENIKSLSYQSFSSSSLKIINLSQINITVIPSYCFSGCTSLTSITLPNNLIRTETNAFLQCKFSSIILPTSFTVFGSYTFFQTALKSINFIGTGVSSLPSCCFESTELVSIFIPITIISIESSAFRDCKYLSHIYIEDNHPFFVLFRGSLFSKDLSKLIRFPCNYSYFSFPKETTQIGGSCFSGTQIATIMFPYPIKTIPTHCFYKCYSIISADLSQSQITSIESRSFYVTNIRYLYLPSSLNFIGGDAFMNCFSLEHVTYCGSKSLTGVLFSDSVMVYVTPSFEHPTLFGVKVNYTHHCISEQLHCTIDSPISNFRLIAIIFPLFGLLSSLFIIQ